MSAALGNNLYEEGYSDSIRTFVYTAVALPRLHISWHGSAFLVRSTADLQISENQIRAGDGRGTKLFPGVFHEDHQTEMQVSGVTRVNSREVLEAMPITQRSEIVEEAQYCMYIYVEPRLSVSFGDATY
jgi:hypothetical protein